MFTRRKLTTLILVAIAAAFGLYKTTELLAYLDQLQ